MPVRETNKRTMALLITKKSAALTAARRQLSYAPAQTEELVQNNSITLLFNPRLATSIRPPPLRTWDQMHTLSLHVLVCVHFYAELL